MDKFVSNDAAIGYLTEGREQRATADQAIERGGLDTARGLIIGLGLALVFWIALALLLI